MPKEYKIERNPTDGMNIVQEQEYLDKMSADGWDLETVLDIPDLEDGMHITHIFDYYFSREIAINDMLRQKQLKEVKPNDETKPRGTTQKVRG